MTIYSQFNVAFGLAVGLALLVLVQSREQLYLILRVSAFVTLLAFPWDFLAIQFRAWDYTDPGLRLFGVPVNDVIFMFLCSLLTTGTLTSSFSPRRGRHHRRSEANHQAQSAP